MIMIMIMIMIMMMIMIIIIQYNNSTIMIVSRSCKRNSKNVRHEVKGDSGGSGSIGISTIEVEGQSEGH